MAIEKVNEEINLEIEPNSAQEIDAPVMEGDALMLEDGSAIVNPAEDTTDQGAFNANLADLIPDDELQSLAAGLNERLRIRQRCESRLVTIIYRWIRLTRI
jgi:hypothetical protein